MQVPGSLLLYLPMAILIVGAVVAMGYVVYLLARGRGAAQGAHPAAQGAPPDAQAAAPADSAGELRALRTAIETLVDQQQVQGETHRQQVNQRLERVGHRMDEVGHQVDGLRNELRHEVRRRDVELDEIRQQIHAIAQRTSAPMLAAPSTALLTGASSVNGTPPAAAQDAPRAPRDEAPRFEPQSSSTAASPEPSLALEDEAAWVFVEPVAAGQPAATEEPIEEAYERPSAEEKLPGTAAFAPEAPLQNAPAEDAPAEDTPRERAPAQDARPESPLRLVEREPVPRTRRSSIFVPMDDFFGAAPVAPAPAAPEGADDLTTISSIDAALQQQLYEAGVTSLENMAHWSRADARRIARQVGVAEEVVTNQWIFEAQAALYERYARPGAF